MARNVMMCLDPHLIVQDKEACSAKFKVVMKKLVQFKRLTMRNFTPYLCSNLSLWTELLRLNGLPLSSLTLDRQIGCFSGAPYGLCEFTF